MLFPKLKWKLLQGIFFSLPFILFMRDAVLTKDKKSIYTGVICLFLELFLICFCYGLKSLTYHKFILKNNNNKADDLFTNIASMIPSVDEVVLLEEKALVYLKDIKGALSIRFNCPIRFMACGSLSERFGVPLVNDWISGIAGKFVRHALLSDQDFLIEPFGITASYSAQSHTIEIVQSESFIKEGYAKLRVSRCMSRRFKLKEGFLSTNIIKHLVKKCISKHINEFPDMDGRDPPCCYSIAFLFLKQNVNIHGPAINVHISTFPDEHVYLADFTFAIPCINWPPESEWPFRSKMWPNQTVVTSIKDLGFHFVPVNQKNDKSKLTWRYSFSLAETELSKQVNEKARKCFLCLKIINVAYLKPICKRLNSYHLKTILFRTLEVTSGNMWSEENILNCLDYLLKALQDAFHQQKCIHFWISRINLFQDFNNFRLSKLEVKVKEIRKNPVPFLYTYSFRLRPSCLPFNKNEKELSCFGLGLYRDDWIMELQIKNSRIRNSMSEETAAEEGNHVRVSVEEAPLNIDSYPVCSHGSFSQNENLLQEQLRPRDTSHWLLP